MRQITWVLLLTLLGTGCGGGALVKRSTSVNQGDTKEHVLSILGPPGDRQFNGKDEAWQYCRTGMSTDQFVVVWLYDGRVTGVTTYKKGSDAGYIGDCSQGFQTIRWEDAPDRTIEIRHR